jgi:hypothetical protein
MTDPNHIPPTVNDPGPVPAQPEATPAIKKSMPVVIGLGAVILIIVLANVGSLFHSGAKEAPRSALPIRPASPNAQQVTSFEAQQRLLAQRDEADRVRQQQLAAQMDQLRQEQAVPGPESPNAAPMTAAQRQAIYGDSPNGPKTTSNVSQQQAEAKQRQLAREKQHQDALNSDTVAIDFARGGTRLIGNVQSVGNAQQRRFFVVFNRAICPDGFSLDLNKYLGLDPLGTTGLATNVNNHILSSFAAAAAIGGLGGLAQIGNNGSILTADTQIRNGISSQTSQEAEQILNHFLNRLPVITVKEGSRARVYINQDILIPSYAEHRVDSAL